MNIIKRTFPTILIATEALALSMTAGAVAGTVITGRQIADNTVTSADVKNRSLKVKDLTRRGQRQPARSAGANWA